MNDFISIEILASIAGCAAVVTLLTQVFKTYLPQNVDTKWLSLAFAVIVGVLRMIYVDQFDFVGIVSGIINIFVLLGVSIGIYEISKSATKFINNKEE